MFRCVFVFVLSVVVLVLVFYLILWLAFWIDWSGLRLRCSVNECVCVFWWMMFCKFAVIDGFKFPVLSMHMGG